MILRKNSKILTHNGKKLSFTPEIFPAGVTTQIVTRQLKSGNDYYPLSLQVREVVIDPILQNNNWATINYVLQKGLIGRAPTWIGQSKTDGTARCRLLRAYDSHETAQLYDYGEAMSVWALEKGLPGEKTIRDAWYEFMTDTEREQNKEAIERGDYDVTLRTNAAGDLHAPYESVSYFTSWTVSPRLNHFSYESMGQEGLVYRVQPMINRYLKEVTGQIGSASLRAVMKPATALKCVTYYNTPTDSDVKRFDTLSGQKLVLPSADEVMDYSVASFEQFVKPEETVISIQYYTVPTRDMATPYRYPTYPYQFSMEAVGVDNGELKALTVGAGSDDTTWHPKILPVFFI